MRSRHPSGPPPTLGSLIANDLLMVTYCEACLSFGRTIDPRELADRFGMDRIVLSLDPLYRCGQCGVKGRASVQVKPRNMPKFDDHYRGHKK